jgi:Uncharacterized conserved protein (DUF2190)
MKTTFSEYVADPKFRRRVDDISWILESYAESDDPVRLSWVATELGVSLDIAATWCALVGGEVGEPIRFRTPAPRDFSWTSAPPSPVPSGTSSAVPWMRDQVVRGGCSGLQCGHRRKSGDLIIVGALAGLAAYDAAAGYPVEVSGVWELPKTSGQINEGARCGSTTPPDTTSSMPALQRCSQLASPCRRPVAATPRGGCACPAFE